MVLDKWVRAKQVTESRSPVNIVVGLLTLGIVLDIDNYGIFCGNCDNFFETGLQRDTGRARCPICGVLNTWYPFTVEEEE